MSFRFLIILFLSTGLLSLVKAQPHSSLNNKFTVDYIQGCAGMNIQVNYPGCGTTDFCAIIFGDGRAPRAFEDGDIVPYPTAGSFMMKIIYAATTVGNDSIPILVTPNNPPLFDVYSCNGNMVSVKVNESNYPFYIIDYNDASPEVTVPANAATDIHTYAAPPPNTRNVEVRGWNGGVTQDNCAPNPLTVDVYSALPATNITQVEVLNSTQVKVDFNTVSSIQYRMMIATNNTTGFQQFKTIYNPPANTETVPGIRPDDNFYCFRMDTYNPCTNNVVATSPIVCSVNFDAVALNNQNQLTWITAPSGGANNYANFTIRKEGVDLAPNIPPGQFNYTDTDVTCNMDTSYQVIINYPGNVKSISMQKSLTSFSTDTPSAIEDITASVVNGNVELSWVQDPAFTAKEYSITKSVNGSFSLLGKTPAPAFTDASYSAESPVCYQIAYEDACLNESPASLLACPVQLEGDLQKDNVINLSWTDYNGWQNGVVNYTVEKYSSTGELLQTFTVTPSPGTAPALEDDTEDFLNQIYTYIVYAHPTDGGLPVAASNPVTVIKEANLYYPTAFTPGNSGPPENNRFRVFGQYITSFEMRIFNRWGEQMYVTDDLESAGWDGTFKGNLMPEAAYVFRATLKDLAGRTFERSGSFLLLRAK